MKNFIEIFKNQLSYFDLILIKDFNEIKFISNTTNVNKISTMNFALSTYRKIAEDFISILIDLNIDNVEVIFPRHICSCSNSMNKNLIIDNVLLQSQKINKLTSKGRIVLTENRIFINEKNNRNNNNINNIDNTDNNNHNDNNVEKTLPKERIIFNPIDGFLCFISGVDFFSISIAYQKLNEISNKYETVYSIVYSPITKDIYSGDKITGAKLNQIKINCSNQTNPMLSSIILSKIPQFVNMKDFENFNEINIMQKFDINFILSNKNLALCYIGSGKFGCFIDPEVIDTNELIAGMFIAEISGAKKLTISQYDMQKLIITNESLLKTIAVV